MTKKKQTQFVTMKIPHNGDVSALLPFRKEQSKVCRNAAYTSTIGNIVNDQYPDPIAASMEVARRGIESRVVKGSNAFYPPLVSRSKLQNRWKEEEVPEFETWIELHNWLKTGVRYRVPIPEIGMFRIFNNKQSKVIVL